MQVPQIPMYLGFPLARAHAIVDKSRTKKAIEEVLGPEGYDIKKLVKGSGRGATVDKSKIIEAIEEVLGPRGFDIEKLIKDSGRGATAGRRGRGGGDWGEGSMSGSVSSGGRSPSPSGSLRRSVSSSDEYYSPTAHDPSRALTQALLHLRKVRKYAETQHDDDDTDSDAFRQARDNLEIALAELRIPRQKFDLREDPEQEHESNMRLMTKAVLESQKDKFDALAEQLLDGTDDEGLKAVRQEFVDNMGKILRRIQLIGQETGEDKVSTQNLRDDLHACQAEALKASEEAEKKIKELQDKEHVARISRKLVMSIIRQDPEEFNEASNEYLKGVSGEDEERRRNMVEKARRHFQRLKELHAKGKSSEADLVACRKDALQASAKAIVELNAKDALLAAKDKELEAVQATIGSLRSTSEGLQRELDDKDAEFQRLTQAGSRGDSDTSADLEKCQSEKTQLIVKLGKLRYLGNLLELQVRYQNPRLHPVFENFYEADAELKLAEFFIDYMMKHLERSTDRGKVNEQYSVLMVDLKPTASDFGSTLKDVERSYREAKTQIEEEKDKLRPEKTDIILDESATEAKISGIIQSLRNVSNSLSDRQKEAITLKKNAEAFKNRVIKTAARALPVGNAVSQPPADTTATRRPFLTYAGSDGSDGANSPAVPVPNSRSQKTGFRSLLDNTVAWMGGFTNEEGQDLSVADTADAGVSGGRYTATSGTADLATDQQQPPLPPAPPLPPGGEEKDIEESKESSRSPRRTKAGSSVPDETYVEQMKREFRDVGGNHISYYPNITDDHLNKYLAEVMKTDVEVLATRIDKKKGENSLKYKKEEKRKNILRNILTGGEKRNFNIGMKNPGGGPDTYASVELTATQTYIRYKELRNKLQNMDLPGRKVRLFLLVIHNEGLVSTQGIVYINQKSKAAFDLSELFPWL